MKNGVQMTDLARNILALGKVPLTKVRFAKTIYFVHKELIRNNLANKSDIQYIRMPLGPVPEGFMQLTEANPEITCQKVRNPQLAYEAVEYSTQSEYRGAEEAKTVILGTLKTLRKFNTSNLVDTSHQDPSWQLHKNGDVYFIGEDDMARDLSILERMKNSGNENNRMQASLVNGMIDDIVAESTALEFPE